MDQTSDLPPILPDMGDNRFAAPLSRRAQPPWAVATVLCLMVAALVPRALMAGRVSTLCVDGVGYVGMAEAIERGEHGWMGSLYRLNSYPLILAGLHHLGLSWETAGKLWGVLCSVLVVPALFGWVRREFNDSTAIMACLLYAAHAKLIEWSPETIRDSTFWPLFTWCVYFMQRAFEESRLRHFAVVGLLLPSCMMTRFEGVFLLILLGGWLIVRFRHLRESRMRLVAGTALAVLIAPVLLSIINLAWLKQNSWTDLVYAEPIKRLVSLTQTLGLGNAGAAGTELAVSTAESVARPSPFSGMVIWKTLSAIERGLTPVFTLFALAGLWIYRRRFMQSDQLVLATYVAAIIGSIWIHRWYCGDASSRYSLTLVILGTRSAAAAVLRLAAAWHFRYSGMFAARQYAMILVGGITLLGWYDALSTSFATREEKAEIGRWIRRTYGEDRRVVGVDPQLPLVGYYAQARYASITPQIEDAAFDESIRRIDPDVVLLAYPPASTALFQRLSQGDASIGLHREHPSLPVSLRSGTLVLSRDATYR